jgi:hypothetical protein
MVHCTKDWLGSGSLYTCELEKLGLVHSLYIYILLFAAHYDTVFCICFYSLSMTRIRFIMSNDICTTIWWQLLWQPFFPSSYWSKTIERKRKRENKNIMWVWKRKLFKSCHKMVVQISFLFIIAFLKSVIWFKFWQTFLGCEHLV